MRNCVKNDIQPPAAGGFGFIFVEKREVLLP